MRRQLRRSGRDVLALATLMVVGMLVALYILDHQRLRLPLLDPKAVEYKAELATAQAVAPGQGQTVRISGVRVGAIGAVELREGRAVVTMEIDEEYAPLVKTDASVLLRPKTGLKDMFLELQPGSDGAPRAEPGFTIPIDNSLPDVNPDQLLAMLDSDTRSYLQLLLNGAGEGLERRGGELREIFRRFEPTTRDLARVTRGVAERRRNLRRLVRSLHLLSRELGEKDEELAELVSSSAEVFRAVAAEDRNVSSSLGLLPAALRETRGALQRIHTFADELRPASAALGPVARELEPAGRALAPFARVATPIVRSPIRPFVRELRPLVRDLRPAADDLARGTPAAGRGVGTVNRLLNILTFNQDGREPPEKDSRDEGYLFWGAWASHDALPMLSGADAHGPLRPIGEQGSCNTFLGFLDGIGDGDPEDGDPLVGMALRGFEGVFTDPRVCGGTFDMPAAASGGER